jgi:death-on-curing protein
MKTPVWVPVRAVVAIQLELIAEHGGLGGPPRIAALEAALARPKQQFSYATSPPSLERLAAAYGYALARNHCFPDGNKRVALAVIDVFLQLNGRELLAEEVDAANAMQRVAAGDLTEEQLADWIAAHAADQR